MADQSAFDQQHIEVQAMSEVSGLLDQLNLPPAVISFMRKNQRMLWGIVIAVATVVVAVALYSSYRTYQINKGLSALDSALQADEKNRVSLLTEVAEQYASTPSGPWARLELAKIAADKGDISNAITALEQVNGGISEKNPLKPLLLYRLAGFNEQKPDLDKAANFYTKLEAYPGFAADAHYAKGRIFERLGKNDEAINQYQQYLTLTATDSTSGSQPDPTRTMIEYTIKKLQ